MKIFLGSTFDQRAINGAHDHWQNDVWVVLRYMGEYYRTDTTLEEVIVTPELHNKFVQMYIECYETTFYMFP